MLRAGLPAAGWALLAGVVAVAVPVLVLWVADSRSHAGAGAAARTAAQVWLVAHGAALHVPGGTVGLAPLGLMALPLLLLERAARSAAGQHAVATLADAGRLAAGVAGPYALVLTVVAGLSGSEAVQPALAQALVGASLLGLVGAFTGVVRGAGLGGALADAVPARLRAAGPPAAAVLLALLGLSAALVGGSLAFSLVRGADLAAATAPGVVGGLGLLLVGVLLAPTAVVWGAAYVAGPGFALGAGAVVSPTGVGVTALPPLPVLAALPAGALPRVAALALLAVPVLLGVLAGRLAERRGAGLVDGLLIGPLAGAGLALLAAVSSGPVGGGALRELGPGWLPVGLAVTAEVTCGVLLWDGARRLRRS